ncbi:MAG: hypothetical protein HYV09_34595 [Deltaproteobacteria bacterium]|nr:hypothetical protein [Deltaproteobacteria bacterium]
MPTTFAISSRLATPANEVWRVVSSMRGVNDELAPWLRMTHPRGVDRLDAQEVPLGRPLFRSWLLLFGVLPVDFDHIGFARVEPGRGFREESTMLTMRAWTHERTIAPVLGNEGGCELTDRIELEPRLALALPLSQRITAALFRHRHRRLRARFGELPASAGDSRHTVS